MNERFYELPKDKQDRMINGAMRIFSENGYKHASTDEMVKVSGVSKGLWFHYFDNKNGLYYYVCSYAVKYALLEYEMMFDMSLTDFFDIYGAVEKIKASFTDKYPFMPLMLNSIKHEDNTEAVKLIGDIRDKYKQELSGLYLRADVSVFKRSEDAMKMGKMLEYTFDGLTENQYRQGMFSKSVYLADVEDFLKMTRNMVLGR